MAENNIPIEISVGLDEGSVTRAMRDIERKVESEGRKVGKKMAETFNDGPLVRQYVQEFKKELRKKLTEQEKINRILRIEEGILNKHMTKVLKDEQQRRRVVNKAHLKAILEDKKRTLEKQIAIENAHTAAIIENNRRAAKLKIAEAKKEADAIKKLRYSQSQEGIFKVAGIKGPAQRVTEIRALKMAQQELHNELSKGTITGRQYSTMLWDTQKRLNLLIRGDSRARSVFHRFIAKTASLTFELTGAIYGFIAAAGAIASPAIVGVGFLREIEDAQLGIAGILRSMGELNGETLTFEQGMEAAGEQIDLLRRDAIQLAGTLGDFTKTFQATLAPGMAAGMTLDEIRKVATAGTVAVKTIGLDSRQIVQEIRDLVAGGIQAASSTLATSLGLTDRDIKKAKLSAEGLYEFLMRRLEMFHDTAKRREKTLSGSMEKTWEIFVQALASASEPMMDTLKDIFLDIRNTIANETPDGKLIFKEEFISAVRKTIDLINMLTQGLFAVLKFLYEMRDLLIIFATTKIISKIWEWGGAALLKYHSQLKGVLATTIALEAVNKAAAFGPVTGGLGAVFNKTRDKVVADGIIKTVISGAGTIKTVIKSVAKWAVRFLPFGMLGLVAWGAFEGYQIIMDKFKKGTSAMQAEIAKTNAQIAREKAQTAIEDQDKFIKSLEVSVAATKKALSDAAEAGVSKDALSALQRKAIELEEKLEKAKIKSLQLKDANRTLSDQITRSNAAVERAKKVMDALGGAYSKAAKEAGDTISAILALHEAVEANALTTKKFEEKVRTGSMTSDDKKTLKYKLDSEREVIDLLKNQLIHNAKLKTLEAEKFSARKGSREEIRLDHEIKKTKELTEVIAAQTAYKKNLADINDQLYKTQYMIDNKVDVAGNTKRKTILEEQRQSILAGLNLENKREQSIRSKTGLEEVEENFQQRLKESTEVVYDYAAAIREQIAAEQALLSNKGNKTFDSIIEQQDEQYRNIIEQLRAKADEEAKKPENLGKDKDVQQARIQEQLDKNVRFASELWQQLRIDSRGLWDAKEIQKWDEELQNARKTTEDYLTSVKDIIEQKEIEYELSGKVGVEVEIYKEEIRLQKVLTKLRRDYKKLKGEGNTLAADDLKEQIKAAEEGFVSLEEKIRSNYERTREWSFGQRTAFDEYVENAKDAAAQAKEFYSSTFSALEEDMKEAFESGSLNFDKFTKAVLDGIMKIAIQKVIAGVITSTVGASSGGGGSEYDGYSGGEYFGGDGGYAKGGAFDREGVIKFAKGGMVQSPTTFRFANGTGLMGEAGPEAIMPLSRTTSGDLGVKVDGGLGGTVNNVNVSVNVDNQGNANVNTDDSMGEQKAKQFGKLVSESVKKIILEEQRPGGLLNRR